MPPRRFGHLEPLLVLRHVPVRLAPPSQLVSLAKILLVVLVPPLTLLLLGDVLKYQLYDGTSCYDSSHTPDVGILLEDAALRTCSPAHCTSDDGEGGEDCHAGQRYEGCTCSSGYSARATPRTRSAAFT